MATYEIGNASARIIHQALTHWRNYEDEHDQPRLDELIELFAPPEPPTAAELAEALRAALYSDEPDALEFAGKMFARWTDSQP